MNTHNKSAGIDMKVLLSTIWTFVVLNYLYCDVITLMDSEALNNLITGTVGGMEITQGFLLGAAILMEISIAMVLLSRVLNYKANRVANIIAGIITTVVHVASLTVGDITMYYWFFSLIEMACTALIVWLAWGWRNSESLDVKDLVVTGQHGVKV